MAKFHDVTVLTRANNRLPIEKALATLRGNQPLPTFVYHDRSPSLLEFKRRFRAVKVYYLLWQKSARDVVARLHQEQPFDLMHHVTFAAFRYPIAIWGHGVPCIWGPVGGIESIPRGLLPWHHPVSLAQELTRNLHNVLQSTPFNILPRRARATALVLASTREMQGAFRRLGIETEVMPTIGLNPAELAYRQHPPREGPLKFLFVGNIITLKGIDIALEALAQSGTKATLTLVGQGNFQPAAAELAKNLGLADRVEFLGRLPREQVLKLYPDFDIFLFPSLHDTGGYAVIEAMFNELPVICLDCGGPGVAVPAGGGIKVPITSRHKVIAELAGGIRWYAENRSAIAEHGRVAREAVLRNYDWQRKGVQMNACYAEAIRRQVTGKKRYSGMGGFTNLLHGVFSLRGFVAGSTIFFLLGTAGFLSVEHLKRQARSIVSDTLPGLSYAGEANASMAQAFNRTMLLMTTQDPAQRSELRTEIERDSARTTHFLEAYRGAIFDPRDQKLYDSLLLTRIDYLAIRQRAIDILETNGQARAIEVCKQELLPAYSRYKQAGDKVFEYNMHQGQERGRTIMLVCTLTQILLAVVVILIFIVGFVAGMFR
jgi:glycosyltransferase involved in cell wall biosynthesis